MDRKVTQFLDRIVRFRERMTFVTETSPPVDAFVKLNIDLCSAFQFHPEGLPELANAILGLHDGCNANEQHCDYHVNIDLGADDCKLEVAKADDYRIPIHYGYLVGDNVVQMVHAMERVIMPDRLEDCFRYCNSHLLDSAN
eukprot:sb/3474227/